MPQIVESFPCACCGGGFPTECCDFLASTERDNPILCGVYHNPSDPDNDQVFRFYPVDCDTEVQNILEEASSGASLHGLWGYIYHKCDRLHYNLTNWPTYRSAISLRCDDLSVEHWQMRINILTNGPPVLGFTTDQVFAPVSVDCGDATGPFTVVFEIDSPEFTGTDPPTFTFFLAEPDCVGIFPTCDNCPMDEASVIFNVYTTAGVLLGTYTLTFLTAGTVINSSLGIIAEVDGYYYWEEDNSFAPFLVLNPVILWVACTPPGEHCESSPGVGNGFPAESEQNGGYYLTIVFGVSFDLSDAPLTQILLDHGCVQPPDHASDYSIEDFFLAHHGTCEDGILTLSFASPPCPFCTDLMFTVVG